MTVSPRVRRCTLFVILAALVCPLGTAQVDPTEVPTLWLRDALDLSSLASALNDAGLRREVATILATTPMHALHWRRFYIGPTEDRIYFGSMAFGNRPDPEIYIRFIYFHDSGAPYQLAYAVSDQPIPFSANSHIESLVPDSLAFQFGAYVLANPPQEVLNLIGREQVAGLKITEWSSASQSYLDLILQYRKGAFSGTRLTISGVINGGFEIRRVDVQGGP